MERERALISLRQALWQLRTVLGPESIRSQGKRLVLHADLSVDLLDFRAAAEAQREEALALFTGRFMESVSFPGAAAYEQWADLQRARADSLLLHAAEGIVNEALREGRLGDAVGAARRTRDLLPRQQGAWRLLIESFLAVGDRPMALVESDVLLRWMEEDEEEPEPPLLATLKALQRARDGVSASRREHDSEFVGREVEFASLVRAYHASTGGKPRHVHVGGAAGMGKSRLLSEIAERYRALRARVAMVSAVPSDRGLPYSLLARIAETIGALPGSAGVAPESAAVLVRLAPALSSTFSVASDTRRSDDALPRTQALRDLVGAVAAERHLVLMVDDLHWADRESLDALARVADRLPTGVLLVTAARPPLALHSTTTAETLSLAPLTVDQVELLLAGLGFQASDDDAQAVPVALANASGGSPLLILQLVRQGVEERWLVRDGDRLSAPPGVDVGRALECADPIGRRLGDVSDDERRTLQLVALAGFAMDEEVLASAMGNAVDQAVQALAARGLLTAVPGGWSCAHDMISERVLSLCPGESKRAASVALGRALAARATTARDARVAACFLTEGGDAAAVRALLLREVERSRSARRPVPAREVMSEIVGGVIDDRQMNAVLRSLPLRYRFSRRQRLASSIVVVAAAALVSAAVMQRGRVRLAIVQSPAGSAQAVDDRRRLELRPPLVVEQRGRDGGLHGGPGDTIDVVLWDDSLRRPDSTSLPISGGRASFDAISVHNHPRGHAVVRRRGTSDSLRVQVMWHDTLPTRLNLVSWSTNAGTVTPGHNTFRMPPGATIEGTVRIEYASSVVDATLVYAATPTWGDPSREGLTIGVLSAPSPPRQRGDPLSFRAPDAPGEYFFILTAGAETEAKYLLSRTNWVVGEPVWGDGNDVAQWPREDLLRLMRGESARAKTLKFYDGKLRYMEDAFSAIAFRVIVDPAVAAPTVE